MTLKEALKHFDTKADLARALGISKQAVNRWDMEDQIPELRALTLKHEILPSLKKPKTKTA